LSTEIDDDLTLLSALSSMFDEGYTASSAMSEASFTSNEDAMELDADERGATEPDTMNPNAKDPNAKDPYAKDPNAKDPNAKDPNAKDSQEKELDAQHSDSVVPTSCRLRTPFFLPQPPVPSGHFPQCKLAPQLCLLVCTDFANSSSPCPDLIK
jgi:hypothetical protein